MTSTIQTPEDKKIDSLIHNAVYLKFKKAKRIAVENYCWTAADDKMANHSNLQMDANLYKWNSDTVKAIKYVLKELGKL